MPRERAKERACEKAIKKTLAYRVAFKYPLSYYQLSTFLISKRKYDHNFFSKTVRRLTKNKTLGKKDRKYYLPIIKPVSWSLRKKYSEEHYTRCTIPLNLIKAIPWIKMLAVTGSVAACNSEKESDLDVFIVTAKKRIWLTRGFVAVLLKIVGAYPRQKTPFIKICPNLFVDERNLTWQKKKQTIYTAHEILLMQPIYDKDETYFKFLKSNEWAFKNFVNFRVTFPNKFTSGTKGSRLMDVLEKIAMHAQLKLMKQKKTNEVTTNNFIHFNKNDNSDWINQSYKENLKNC